MTRVEQQQRTRDEIVLAADRLFVEHGFHATSVDQIAAAAGYTKGAVYSNFDAKEDVFFAVYERRVQRGVEELERDARAHARRPRRWIESLIADTGHRRGRDDRWLSTFFEFWAHVVRRPALRARFADHPRADPRARSSRRSSVHADERGIDLPAIDPRRGASSPCQAMSLGLDARAARPARRGRCEPRHAHGAAGARRSVRGADDVGADEATDGRRTGRCGTPARWPSVNAGRSSAARRCQRERLTELVGHAAQHSPYYREALAGYDPDVGLGSLPALSKATMMERFDDLVSDRRLRRDALLAHVEQPARRRALPGPLPRHDDQRLVGAQGPLRLRRGAAGRRSGPVPVLQRRSSGPARASRGCAWRLIGGGLAGAHEPPRRADPGRRLAPDPLAAGHAAAGRARRGAQPLPARCAERLPVDGRAAGRGAARRAAAIVAADDVDQQRAAHARGGRTHRGGVRRAAVRPLRDDRRAVGRRMRAPRRPAPLRGGRHRRERRRGRARGARRHAGRAAARDQPRQPRPAAHPPRGLRRDDADLAAVRLRAHAAAHRARRGTRRGRHLAARAPAGAPSPSCPCSSPSWPATATSSSSRSCRRARAWSSSSWGAARRPGSRSGCARACDERLQALGVQDVEIDVRRCDALERSAGGKLALVVAGRPALATA